MLWNITILYKHSERERERERDKNIINAFSSVHIRKTLSIIVTNMDCIDVQKKQTTTKYTTNKD